MYMVLEEERVDEGNHPYRTYGIRFDGEDAAEVHDLSTDRELVERLVETCNRVRVSPTHLDEVVDDWLE